MSSKGPPRTAVLWCPDWPVIAAEIVDGRAGAPGRWRCCTPTGCSPAREAARAEGVRRGLRKREAQSRCPQLIVVEHDPGRDARAFEPVVAAVEELARRGRGDPARRAARWPPGGRPATSAARRRRPSGSSSTSPRRARWRARSASPTGCSRPGWPPAAGRIVAPGETPEFLAGLTVEALDRPDAGRPAAPARRADPRRLRGAARRRTCWPGSGSTRRWRTGCAGGRRPPAARGPPAAARPGRHRDVRRAAGAGRRGRVRRPGAGRTAARPARRARAGLHPARHRGGHRGRAGAAPGLAARRAAHRGGDRRPGALAARRLADRQPAAAAPTARPTAGHRAAAADPRRGAGPRSACSPACGARPARSASGRTGR